MRSRFLSPYDRSADHTTNRGANVHEERTLRDLNFHECPPAADRGKRNARREVACYLLLIK